jgi:hypothetical protein
VIQATPPRAVNAEWRLPVAGRPQAVAACCSSLGPFNKSLQRARNTQFEFVLTGFARLDKNAVSQHADAHLASQDKQIRFRLGLAK